MAQLYRYPEGLRMGEISQLLMVTGGNITGIIEQLVQEGLVLRVSDPNDRRAYTARLSESGKSSFFDSWYHSGTACERNRVTCRRS